MLRIIGKDNMHMTKHFNEGLFHRPYDVKLQNSSALPQHVSAKTQNLIDLKESFPNVVSDQMVVNMLDLAQDKKFRNLASISAQAAASEYDSISRGEATQDPMAFEDHLVHWDAHQKELQSRNFKERVDPSMVQRLAEHVLTHEMFIWERAKRNPVYMSKVVLLDNFPSFYKIPENEITLLQQITGGSPAQAGGRGIPNQNQVPLDQTQVAR
jgi:hypothetical protein